MLIIKFIHQFSSVEWHASLFIPWCTLSDQRKLLDLNVIQQCHAIKYCSILMTSNITFYMIEEIETGGQFSTYRNWMNELFYLKKKKTEPNRDSSDKIFWLNHLIIIGIDIGINFVVASESIQLWYGSIEFDEPNTQRARLSNQMTSAANRNISSTNVVWCK